MVVVQFMQDAGIVGWLIVLCGLFTLYFIFERANKFYRTYTFDTKLFWQNIENYLIQQENEKAIMLCLQHQQKPIASAIKKIIEKSHSDYESIQQAESIAISETVPLFTKNLHLLSMFANVATLLGLLGTIHGLILSFQAVAVADPSQKQILLAHGISVSMYTTALGLAVAIPAMIFYSVLVGKQNEHLEILSTLTQKSVELISGVQNIQPIEENIYKENQTMIAPPPFQRKSS